MKIFIVGTILASCAALLQGAAIVTCSSPNGSQTVYNGPCFAGSGTNTLEFGAGTSSAVWPDGIFRVMGMANLVLLPYATVDDPGAYPLTATASWNDTFALPASNPDDILEIWVTGGGLRHPASIQVGSIDYEEANFCDMIFMGQPACSVTSFEVASQAPTVTLTGSDNVEAGAPCGVGSVEARCLGNTNVNLWEEVTVQRFLSDGVTPDPFSETPEPASSALLFSGLGLIALGCRKLRQVIAR